MKTNHRRFIPCALAFLVVVILAGCAAGSPLKTENLFRDDVVGTSETVADYDALVFASSGAEIYGLRKIQEV